MVRGDAPSSTLTFNSDATASEQGVVHAVGGEYRSEGRGNLDSDGRFTSNSVVIGHTLTDTDTESSNLYHTSRSGASATSVGGTNYGFVFTDQGEKVDATFDTTVSATAGGGISLFGTATIKADPTDPTDVDYTLPIHDNDASTYQLDVTHTGTSGYDNLQAAGQTISAGTTSGSGHVTRTETITNRDTGFSGTREEDLDGLPEQEERILLAAGGASGFSFSKSLITVINTEDYDYTDDNGALTREGTFDTRNEGSNEFLNQIDHTTNDSLTSYTYREDGGARAENNVVGSFKETTGTGSDSSTAEGQTEDKQETFRTTKLRYSTRDDSGDGNRSSETSHFNTKGKVKSEYEGLVTLDNTEGSAEGNTEGNDKVDTRAGQDSSEQFGQVAIGGTSFRESHKVDTTTGTVTHTVSTSNGNDRSEQTAEGDMRSTQDSGGQASSTGNTSASQSGTSNDHGKVSTTEFTRGADSTERVTTLSKLDSKSEGKNTSSGDVTVGSDGTNAAFDVTSDSDGHETLKTKRTRNFNSNDGAGATSRSKSSVTRTDASETDLSTTGKITLDGGDTAVESGLPTGPSGNEVTIEHTLRENSKSGAFATPRYAFSNNNGTLSNDADVTLSGEGSPQDLESIHAKLVKKWSEDSKETSGWRAFDLTNGIYKGETTKRTINGEQANKVDADLDTDLDANLDTDEQTQPTANGSHTDEIKVVSWYYDVTDEENWTKNNRTETSTQTTNNSDSESTTSFVVDLDVDNRTRSTPVNPTAGDPEQVTIKLYTIDSTDTQTQTVKQGEGNPEHSLKITSDKTTKDRAEVKNALYPLKQEIFGKVANDGFNTVLVPITYFSSTDYTDTTTFVKKSNYDSTHKIDKAGRVSGGKFTADSTSEKSTSFKGSRDDPPMTPDTPLDPFPLLPFPEQHRLHTITTQSRKVDEKGNYHDDASGKRVQSGRYTETTSTSEEFKEAQQESHDPIYHDYGFPPDPVYADIAGESRRTSKLTKNNQSTKVYKGTYGPEGQTRKLTTDTKKIKEGLLLAVTEDVYASKWGFEDNRQTEEITWNYTNVVPSEGDRHGEDTVYVVRTSTFYSTYYLTLDTIDGTQYGEQVGALYQVEGFTYKNDLFDGEPPQTPPRELTREEINASIAAGALHNEQIDSWWWAATKSFFVEAGYQITNAAADEVPYLGQVKGAAEFAAGKDIRGDDLGLLGRGGAALNMIPGGGIAKRSIEGGALVGKGSVLLFKGLFSRGAKNADTVARTASDANRALRTADGQVDNALAKLDDAVDEVAKKSAKAARHAKPVRVEVELPRGSAKYTDELGNAMGAARPRYRILQSGGNKIQKQTAKALNESLEKNLHSREWGRSLEKMKKDLSLPNDHHGKIDEFGGYWDGDGNLLGNIEDYLP